MESRTEPSGCVHGQQGTFSCDFSGTFFGSSITIIALQLKSIIQGLLFLLPSGGKVYYGRVFLEPCRIHTALSQGRLIKDVCLLKLRFTVILNLMETTLLFVSDFVNVDLSFRLDVICF